jgi:glycosyltransferase involved in cell wall biosynthesis
LTFGAIFVKCNLLFTEIGRALVTPSVSAIIPVYNVAPYLAQCLDSVLGQTFTDLEVICVDDGSTDASPEILADYARKDSRLRVFSQEQGGPARARNLALAQAAGEYIAFVDGDDYLGREALEKSLPHLTAEVDYVCFGANVFGQAPASRLRRENLYCNPAYKGLKGLVEVNETVIKGTNVHLWNKIFRRSLIDRYSLSFPGGLFYQDAFFTLAYLLLCRRGYYLPERFYNYRLRPDSTMGHTRQGDFERASDHLLVIQELFRFMKDRGLLTGREAFLTNYMAEYFHLSIKLAPAESRPKIEALAGQFFEEIEAEADVSKAAICQALLCDAEESRHKLDCFLATPWHWLGRKLGLVNLLMDV